MSEDAFLKALEKNQKRKEDEEAARQQGGFTGFGDNFYNIEKMNLPTGQESVFRIIGKPYEIRTEPTDAKFIFHSRILNDKGKYTHIFWPTVMNDEGLPELDTDWELFQIYKKVTEGTWRSFSEEEIAARADDKKGEKEYTHANTKAFEWVNGNKAVNQLYPPKFIPKKRVVFNAINRHNDWCKKNKKAVVPFAGLSYGKSQDGGEIEFINDVGIPFTAYNAIMESVVAFTKHWDIDIVMLRTKDKNNAYIVRDVTEKKISPNSAQIGTDVPLTEEEKKYELINLDDIFASTGYMHLIRAMGGKIKLVDAELGTSFYEVIKAKAEKEEKERKEKQAQEQPKEEKSTEVIEEEKICKEEVEATPETKEAVEEAREIVNKPEVARGRQRTVEQEQPKEEVNKMEYIKNLPNFTKLDNLDIDDIESHLVGVTNNVPVWSDNGLDIIPCDNKECNWPGTEERTKWPNSVLNCAVCGLAYKQA